MLECGLWRALEAGDGKIYAVVTDIGNDIGYGVQPAVLVGWVTECLDRLQAFDAKVAVVLPPVASPWFP